MADWVNWGDFLGANQAQMADYNQRVADSQAQQQASYTSMTGSYSDTVMKAGADYATAKQREDALASARDTYLQNADKGKKDPALRAATESAASDVASSNKDAATDYQGIQDSYSKLQDAATSGKSAFKGYSGNSGWESALYGGQTQYADPWSGLSDYVAGANKNATTAAGATDTGGGAIPSWSNASWDVSVPTWRTPAPASTAPTQAPLPSVAGTTGVNADAPVASSTTGTGIKRENRQ